MAIALGCGSDGSGGSDGSVGAGTTSISGAILLIPSPILSKLVLTAERILIISSWRAIAFGSSNGGAVLIISINAVNWLVSVAINPGIASTLALVCTTSSCNALISNDMVIWFPSIF